jgi:hypothetical protein
MRASAVNTAAIVLGLTLTAGGVLDLLLPKDMLVYHHHIETSHADIEWVTPEGMRAYGILGATLGVGLIWYAASPLRRKAAAIDSYVWDLSRELKHHFGERRYYSIGQVSHAAEVRGFKTAFIAYAHAMFCTRDAFDKHYTTSGLASTYNTLRAPIERRYFDGATGFNAATIVRMAQALYDDKTTSFTDYNIG